jgi:acyl carrier protein
MTVTTYEQLREIALDELRGALERRGLNPARLDDGMDLLAAGVIDSFGFIDLVAAMETRSGLGIDLAAVPPETLTTVRGLVQGFLQGASA